MCRRVLACRCLYLRASVRLRVSLHVFVYRPTVPIVRLYRPPDRTDRTDRTDRPTAPTVRPYRPSDRTDRPTVRPSVHGERTEEKHMCCIYIYICVCACMYACMYVSKYISKSVKQ